MILDKYEEAALLGEHGEIMQMAYRVLVSAGEAADASRLIPVKWVHLSGVNYNTIGDAGEEFLRSIRDRARVRVWTTLNPMGYDRDHVGSYDLDQNFIEKQESIRESYRRMGVVTSFSCVPYDIFDMPPQDSQVALAESNAAIHANTFDGLKTNKESAFTALASALTGKSPHTSLRGESQPDAFIRMDIDDPTELDWGLLGYMSGQISENYTRVGGGMPRDRRSCKALCGGAGTSGTCARLDFGNDKPDECSDAVSFDKNQSNRILESLNTAESGDRIILGSPQLGMTEIQDLVRMMAGRKFKKECMIFCPRTVKERAISLGYAQSLEGSGCKLLADCCACLTPLLSSSDTDSVITSSVKGAYYMSKSNKIGVCLKPLRNIIRDDSA